MSIEFRCSSCGSTLRVEDSHRGKLARCPTCQMIVPIPGTSDLRETAVHESRTGSLDSPQDEPRWLVRTPDGTLYGPARRSELLVWQSEGRISPECRLQQVGQPEWLIPAMVLGNTSPQATRPVYAKQEEVAPQGPYRYPELLPRRRAHNGSLIIVLAVIGWFFLPLAIVAFFIGMQELKGMDRGEIDDSGRSLVRVGIGIAIVGGVLSMLTNCCCCFSLTSTKLRG